MISCIALIEFQNIRALKKKLKQVQNQFLQTNAAYASLHHQKTLEDTLQAFVQSQTQFNQITSQNLQELKNSLDRIESHLNEKENEFFPAEAQPDPMTQCGNNEIKNPQVDDDKPKWCIQRLVSMIQL